ncbi:sigma-70 family RNA polymerase sigma factor [Crossiella sp. CA-258035]|uniref:RNA polymerase sigma factor n=1 Tax=Crossiella sp. CA-258035 TaxID=2981138 RepID=UPI0024BD5B3B|nr:sigma-70 family RNA polymerase sigma factor [Crossiella sp. CA-258035]WHT19158.1 sigma-70 family RNA polymerase sigma factor [Crossiella sp. CA-258035]
MDQERLAAAAQRALVRVRAAGASKEQAEDCVQDAVADLLASAHTTPVDRPEAWLTTVSRRRFADQLRRRRREQTALARSDAQRAVFGADPSEAVADRDQARWMAAALDELPETTREVVAMAGAGKPPTEIATELGLSSRSVESHLTRARRLLRRLAAAAVLPLGAGLAGIWRWLGAGNLAGAKVALAAVSVPLALGSLAVLPPLPGPELSPEPPPLALVEVPQETPQPVPPPAQGGTQADPPASDTRQPGSTGRSGSGGNGKADPPAHGKGKDGNGKDRGRKPADRGQSFQSSGWSGHRSDRAGKNRQDLFAGPGGPARQHSGGRSRH